MDDGVFWAVAGVVATGWTALVYALSWAAGHKRGMKDGFAWYVSKLRFDRREEALIDPTDQPHSARPRGRARVTEAHMSQSRRYWNHED